jgi:multidrug transporter EmrE-like cation transporter
LPFPIAVFFAVGSCPLIVKAFQETGLTEQDAPFFLILFCTAFFISTIVWLSYPNRFSSAGFFWGFVLGLSNTMANKFLLQALEDLPGVIVFPVVSAFSLVLTVLFATLVWREKLHRPALCGIALAVVAIALVNIR